MASLSDSLVTRLLDGRYIASLATQNSDGSVHVVAVWYWFDGKCIYVATSGRTRKARNLHLNSNVSVMIDSRDPYASCGISIAGTAQIVTGESSRQWNAQLHRKYMSEAALADPKVGPVFAAMDDVTIRVTPASVISWDMRQIDEQVFDRAIGNNPGYMLPLER